MKKVLIVDDSLYMRTLINSALTATGRYEVIGQAGTGSQGIELALEHEPDLITMDNILPDMIGIDIVKELELTPEELEIDDLAEFEVEIEEIKAQEVEKAKKK